MLHMYVLFISLVLVSLLSATDKGALLAFTKSHHVFKRACVECVCLRIPPILVQIQGFLQFAYVHGQAETMNQPLVRLPNYRKLHSLALGEKAASSDR